MMCGWLVAVLATVWVPHSTLGSSCTFSLPGPPNQCYKYDLSTLTTTDSWHMLDADKDDYAIGGACDTIHDTKTIGCTGPVPPSMAYQVHPAAPNHCFPLGVLTQSTSSLLPGAAATAGLRVRYTGGYGGRSVEYHFMCNESTPINSGPSGLVVEHPTLNYVVTWPTQLACPTLSNDTTGCGSNVVLPTAAQVRWQEDELASIGHFNMGTYQACGIGASTDPRYEHQYIEVPPPETFAPTNVDVEGWIKGLVAYGAKHAVLVVSHGCGFNTFPSRTAFPEFDFVYNYSIKNSPWKGGKGDIAAEFVAAARKHGIRPGFYMGSVNNAFLNVVRGKVQKNWVPGQARITQDQYTKILLAQLRQIWTDYGELAEVWFDGGYPPGTSELIAQLLQELQPNAVAFQGPGKNIVRWVGTESGHAPYPCWSTSASSSAAGGGDPNAKVWVPAEADTCFQGPRADGQVPNVGAPYGGCWFYNKGLVPKTLPDLVSIYHDTVGRNTMLLLDWTPDQTGALPPGHLQRYQEFGNWIRGCYGVPLGMVTEQTGPMVTLELSHTTTVDRVVIQEDITRGQLIRTYSVFTSKDGKTWEPTTTGSSVGYKRIDVFKSPQSGIKYVRLNITSHIGVIPTNITVGVYNCSRTPVNPQCQFTTGVAYQGPIISTSGVSGAQQCCTLCKGKSQCEVFTVHPNKTCDLRSAESGTVVEKGAVSGRVS